MYKVRGGFYGFVINFKEVTVKKLLISTVVLLLGTVLAFGGGAQEPDTGLPESDELLKPSSLSISAWGISGDTYAQYVSVGEALKTKYDISFRVVPTGTDISRMMLLRTGTTNFAAIGSANIYALEGLGAFAALDVGPTPLRAVYLCIGAAGSAAAVRATSDIHTFADLKGIIEAFAKRLFGEDVKIRFRPSFFPFTEPSAEYDFSCVKCGGKGCNICKGTGWLEISGAGMVDPAVFNYVGYDSAKYTGYAFGMGVERIAMLKYQISDIRHFYENDLRFLNQF